MALGASGRRISTVAVVVVVVIVAGVVEGAAAAAAAALFFAVLLGGPEESERLSSHRVIVAAGGGADFLFRGGIGSILGEPFLAAALQLLLEQELEVFAFSLGLIVFGGDPEVELLCIPVQRSERLVRRRRVVLRRRFPTLRNGVEGGGGGA